MAGSSAGSMSSPPGAPQATASITTAAGELPLHDYDVLVIGAGGSGLRAAIEAHIQGARTAIVCKSLLGKAHTVMAEGGIAAAMGNVYPQDNWKVHFRDTMRGGKFLNNWRMAELHAKESPDRVQELEEWGAVFDRTPDGRILQRDFGGHRYARLAHVGDHTGLEMIRTLQEKATAEQIPVFMECSIRTLLKDANGQLTGALGYWRASGEFIVFRAKAIVLATGGIGRAFQFTTNSWESTADGQSLALRAGADLMDMEFFQFHPTGMVWPVSVRGLLVTEGVRGDGGTLKNSEGRRFMFDYVPEMFRAETADTEEEADRWYTDKVNARRTPDLLPRDEVARAINSEVKAGRGSPHGGVYLDIASRRSPEYIKRRLPSMYSQFMELAGVDITKEPMEVGPTSHYAMGGIKVDADTAACTIPALFSSGEAAAGLHGANRLGGNSLSDLVVFGRRAGLAAAEYAKGRTGTPEIERGQIDAAVAAALEPLERDQGEGPYELHQELRETMQSLVGIIRTGHELEEALERLGKLREHAKHVKVTGGRKYNPGWHLAMDLPSLLSVAECVTRSALVRRESRGGHTRDDFPKTDPEFAKVNHVTSLDGDTVIVRAEPHLQPPPELAALLADDPPAGSSTATGSGTGSATAGGNPGATAGENPGATAGENPGSTAGGNPGSTAGGNPGSTAGGNPGSTAGESGSKEENR